MVASITPDVTLQPPYRDPRRPTSGSSVPAASTGYLGNRSDHLGACAMWMWIDQRLRVKTGVEHTADLAEPGEDVEACYRGWYDPSSCELFLIGPAPPPGQPLRPIRAIPKRLHRALQRRFGDQIRFRAF